MSYLFAALAGVVAAEILVWIIRLNIHTRMGRRAGRSVRIMQMKASDHRKQAVLLNNSMAIMLETLKLAAAFAVLVAAVTVIAYVASLLGIALLAFMMTWAGLAYVTAVAVVYAFIRKRFL